MTESGLSRELSLEPGRAALLVVDVQNYCCDRAGGAFTDLDEAGFQAQLARVLHDVLQTCTAPD